MTPPHKSVAVKMKKHALLKIKEIIQKGFICISIEATVTQAIQKVRTNAQKGDIFYLYVTDENDKLCGVLSIRNLLIAKEAQKIREIYSPNAVFLQQELLVEDAYSIFSKSRFLSLPVVDHEGHIKGVLHAHELLEEYEKSTDQLFEERSRGEMYELLGIKAEDTSMSIPRTAMSRFPWLLVNVIGGSISALFIHHLGGKLNRAVEFLAFVPILLIVSESVGMQTASIIMTQLHRVKSKKKGLSLHWKELGVALLLGVTLGAFLGAAIQAWKGDWALSLSIALTTAFGPLLVAIIGNTVPQIFHRFELDARVAAGPVVLAVSDSLTLLLFLLVSLLFTSL